MKLILIILTIFSALLPIDSYAFQCRVASTPMSFTYYDVFSLSPAYSTGTVAVSCNNPDKKPLPVNISIDGGGSRMFNPRQMKATTGTDRLNYYLFTDPSRTIIWGDGTGGTSTVTTTVSKDIPLDTAIFGSLPPQQNVSAGNYGDTVVVTVTW